MSHGLGEHAFLGIAPDTVVFVGIIELRNAVFLRRALPVRIAAVLRKIPPEAAPASYVHGVDLAAIKRDLAIDEAQLGIGSRHRNQQVVNLLILHFNPVFDTCVTMPSLRQRQTGGEAMTCQDVIADLEPIERDTIRRRLWQAILAEKALERERHVRLT